MLSMIRSWLSAGKPSATERLSFDDGLPHSLQADGLALDLSPYWIIEDGLPTLDWRSLALQIERRPESEHAQLLAEAQIVWMAHLGAALGTGYAVCKRGRTLLLCSYSTRLASAVLGFVETTRARIGGILEELAQVPPWGHDILIVFDEADAYYRYIARYYEDEGEFAQSGGIYVNAGCGHFATTSSDGDLGSVEPVIAHELTHALLSHLPIPAWLNEGLAVNCEERLCPPGGALYTPTEMRAKHVAFWNPSTIQEFWSGSSFLRTDDGNMLSYDLAKTIASQLGHDWVTFKQFVLSADLIDGGQGAAIDHFGMDLGLAAVTLVGKEFDDQWSPQPEKWGQEPERGAF